MGMTDRQMGEGHYDSQTLLWPLYCPDANINSLTIKLNLFDCVYKPCIVFSNLHTLPIYFHLILLIFLEA